MMKLQDKNADTFIVFQVADTHYGLPSRRIQQLEMIENITPVPNAAPFIEGVVFTRGQVIPALNLRARFGLEASPHTVRSRLIVASLDGRVIGLIADSAREFVSIPPESIQAPPQGVSGLSGNYLKGIATVEGRVILIVDLNELLAMGDSRASEARV